MSKISAALPPDPFRCAEREVNEWRGRCMHAFARAEACVSECLLALSKAPGGEQDMLLAHLAGQKYEALSRILSAKGVHQKLLASLTEFRRYDGKRAALCHGCSRVTLAPDGDWTVVFRLLTFRSGAESREIVVFEKDEAGSFCEELSRKSQSLCAQLQRLQISLQETAD